MSYATSMRMLSGYELSFGNLRLTFFAEESFSLTKRRGLLGPSAKDKW